MRRWSWASWPWSAFGGQKLPCMELHAFGPSMSCLMFLWCAYCLKFIVYFDKKHCLCELMPYRRIEEVDILVLLSWLNFSISKYWHVRYTISFSGLFVQWSSLYLLIVSQEAIKIRLLPWAGFMKVLVSTVKLSLIFLQALKADFGILLHLI